MLWGCFAAAGIGALHKIDGIMKKDKTTSQNISQKTKSWAKTGLPNGQ